MSQQLHFLLSMTKVVFWIEGKLFGLDIDRAVTCTPDLWNVVCVCDMAHFPVRGPQQFFFQSRSNFVSKRTKFKEAYENVAAF